MQALLGLYQQQFLVFLLVLTRISGLVMVAPIFGPRNAPPQVKVMLVLLLSFLVTVLHWTATFPQPHTLLELIVVLGREAVLGLALGLSILIFFAAMQMAGNIAGQMSGLQLAEAFDPNFDTSVPVFGQLLDLLALAVFVAVSGHQRVVSALLDTFRWRPPGYDHFPTSLVATLTTVMAESFVIALRTAAPIMIALLLSVVILGLLSRTVPQLNVFAIGFNLNALLVLATFAFSLATMCAVVEERADELVEAVRYAVATDQPLDELPAPQNPWFSGDD